VTNPTKVATVASIRQTEFEEFAREARERLMPVLVARYGVDVAADVCADALAYAWEERSRLDAMENPVGYLYRVAQTAARRHRRWSRHPEFPVEHAMPIADVEPGLHDALRHLRPDHRVAVVLIHAYGWTYQEVADVSGVPVSSVRNHLHRGMKSLRKHLGVSDG